MANKSASSRRWLQRQESDPYTLAARANGFRSRAAYKLLEIDEKFNLFANVSSVVDLGAAPGSWVQVLKNKINRKDLKVVALDRLEIEPILGVTCIQGDFTEDDVLTALEEAVGSDKVDIVLSDMAPNMSGIVSVDQPQSMYLVELALDFVNNHLKANGHFVCKIFQGEDFDQFVKDVKSKFTKVQIFKPKSSRNESREVYLIALGYKYI